MSSARTIAIGSLIWLLASPACSSHSVPDAPTWSDVEPILRADCTSCHGGSARTTGARAGIPYRLDFYDLTHEVCGDAASAVSATPFALASAALIGSSITSDSPSVRPRMPPAAGPSLLDWEWQTILRWVASPTKGPTPLGNRPPALRLTEISPSADKTLTASMVLEDPDGESAVGVLTIGSAKLNMDRPGAFAITIDTSAWAEGTVDVQAVVCDGWSSAAYNLGQIPILHR